MQAVNYYDAHKAFLQPLEIGDQVTLQDPHTLQWTIHEKILEARPDSLSYKVAVGNKTQVRARRMLKALHSPLQQANAHLANAQHPPNTSTCAPNLPAPSLQSVQSFHTDNNLASPLNTGIPHNGIVIL